MSYEVAGNEQCSVAGQVLPADWLDLSTSDQERLRGRTGTMPCVLAIAYKQGSRVASADPTPERSALLNLILENRLPPQCVIATAIEPAASETDKLITSVLEQSVTGVVFGACHPSSAETGRVKRAFEQQGIITWSAGLDWLLAERDRRFWVWAGRGRSYVHLKISLTKDGMVVPVLGQTTRLAGPSSARRIHALRGRYDALLMGAGTVRQDNPKMSYRGKEGFNQPIKIVLSRTGRLDPQLSVFQGAPPWICAGEDLRELAEQWAARGVTSVLVEGGWQTYRGFIQQQVADEVSLVWTNKTGSRGGLRLPEGLPLGRVERVCEDTWETIQWPALPLLRSAPATSQA